MGRSWNRKSQEARLCHRRDSAPARPAPGGGGGAAEGPGRGLTGEALEGDRGRAGAGGFAGSPLRSPAMRRALHGTGVRRAGLGEPGGGRGGRKWALELGGRLGSEKVGGRKCRWGV